MRKAGDLPAVGSWMRSYSLPVQSMILGGIHWSIHSPGILGPFHREKQNGLCPLPPCIIDELSKLNKCSSPSHPTVTKINLTYGAQLALETILWRETKGWRLEAGQWMLCINAFWNLLVLLKCISPYTSVSIQNRVMWYSYTKACMLASIASPFRCRKLPIWRFPVRNSADLY